jgi:hypothetical protein
MKTPDGYVTMNLAQKRHGDQPRRPEAEYRLYWSTFQQMVAGEEPAPRRKTLGWIHVRRLIMAMRSWWPRRVPSGMQTGKEGSPAHPLVITKG